MENNVIIQIQSELKAPKSQYNSFGNYNYRSCEDILEALKPILKKHNAYLLVSDEIVLIGARYYVKATASLTLADGIISSTAYAREAEEKKGMDVSQITGAASSYARKYALNGLFAIDDTKDADSNHVVKEEHPEVVNAINNQVKHEPTEDQKTIVGNTISEPQQKRLFAIAKEMGVPKDVIVAYMKENYGIEHSNQIAKGDMYNDICEFVTNFNK